MLKFNSIHRPECNYFETGVVIHSFSLFVLLKELRMHRWPNKPFVLE
jgi:hypothetical protein